MNKNENVYIVYSNELHCRVVGIFKSYNRAENYIKNSNGLVMDVIDQFPVIE